MSHCIDTHDTAYRSSNMPASWHRLEEVVEGDITRIDQIPNVACPIVVEDYPLQPGYVLAGMNCSKQIVAVHPDKKVVLATCSPEYVPIGNDMIFEKVMETFEENEISANLSFAVTMNNMANVSYCFRLNNSAEFFVNGTDKHDLFFNVFAGNSGNHGVRMYGSTIRQVCMNTVQLAMRSDKHIMDATFYHGTKGLIDFKNLPKMVEATLHHATAYSKLAEQMANRPLTKTECKAIAAQMLASKTEISTQVYNQAEHIAFLFENGKGNKGENLWDAFNGTTEYFTSSDGSGKTVTKFRKMVNSEYGNAAERKKDMLVNLQNTQGDLISDQEIDQLIKHGQFLLNQYENNKSLIAA